MSKVLFHTIPDVLFIPVAITALLGILIAAVRQWNRDKALYWTISLSLALFTGACMIWQIKSSRYVSIFVIPAMIFASYFCFECPVILRKYIKISSKWMRTIPVILLGVLALSCMGKNIHHLSKIRPSINYQAIADVICRDLGQNQNSILLTYLDRRFIYYSGTSDIPTEFWNWKTDAGKKIMKKYFYKACDNIYAADFFPNKFTPKDIFPEIPGMSIRNWEQIPCDSVPDSPKGQFRIYKYDINRYYNRNTEPLTSSMILPKPEKVKYLFSPDNRETGEKFYANVTASIQKKFPDAQLPVMRHFPNNWKLNTYLQSDADSVFQMIPENPESPDSKKIFSLKTSAGHSFYETGIYPFTVPYRLYIIFSGEKDTRFQPFLYCYNKKDKKYIFLRVHYFPVQDISDENRKFVYSVDIPLDVFSDCQYFHPGFTIAKGHLLIHEMLLVPQSAEK